MTLGDGTRDKAVISALKFHRHRILLNYQVRNRDVKQGRERSFLARAKTIFAIIRLRVHKVYASASGDDDQKVSTLRLSR